MAVALVSQNADLTMEDGSTLNAVARLRAAIENEPNPVLERQLIDLCIRAARETNRDNPGIEWPPRIEDQFPQGPGLPEINPEELNADALRAGIHGHGGLVVRGLMTSQTVEAMRHFIGRAFEARFKQTKGCAEEDDAPYFQLSSEIAEPGPSQFGKALNTKSSPMTGAIWAAHSPRVATKLLEYYRQVRIPEILNEYFGEPAQLSIRKWALRCVEAEPTKKSAWHQDGQFLGDDIRTVNLWMTLDECGGEADAPGLEMLSGKNEVLYESGTEGARFGWSVSEDVVDEIAQTKPVFRPHLLPGDAVFFDHMNLHRTAHVAHESRNRRAIETWFFSASSSIDKLIPVLIP